MLTAAENEVVGNCLQLFDGPHTSAVANGTLEDGSVCHNSLAVEDVSEILSSSLPSQLDK